MPTFVFPLREDIEKIAGDIVYQMYTELKEDIAPFNRMLSETIGNTWDLATLQLNDAALEISQSKVEPQFVFNQDDIQTYFDLIFDVGNHH